MITLDPMTTSGSQELKLKIKLETTQSLLIWENLNKTNYMFCFANFLLGKGIYGPGKYLFGTFDNREIDEKYKVVYTEECGLDSTWE